MRKRHGLFSGIACAVLIAGCEGSSDPASTGSFSLQVTDDPIDPALIDRVCIAFTAITLHYSGNEDVRLDYAPATSQVSRDTHCTDGWDGMSEVPPVRLDALSGALTVDLVDSLQVPIGRINWIRLHFTDGSYLVDSLGGQHPLDCPSCEVIANNTERGFKLNRTFEVTSAGLSLIVDVDLRKSLHENVSGFVLRPTARIELNDQQGTIAGYVASSLVNDGGVAYVGGDTDTGCAVYVYPDDGTEIGDYYQSGSNVISTATVRYTFEPEPDTYRYAAGALPVQEDGSPESYRVALTCDLDDPLVVDDPADIGFSAPQTAEVVAGQTTNVNFPE